MKQRFTCSQCKRNYRLVNFKNGLCAICDIHGFCDFFTKLVATAKE